KVDSFSVIAGLPKDFKFKSDITSGVRIGEGTLIREHVTINRATHADRFTEIGSRVFLMAASHVAHDCVVGDNVVLANNVMLAGHVTVDENSFIGGGVAVHQFTRIGAGAMI